MPTAPTVELAHGARIPLLGLGTYPMDDAQAEQVVAAALQMGYRLVDTAESYGNEAGVGRGVLASGVPRDEVFVTTKLTRRSHSLTGVRDALEASLGRMGLDRVDLLLIHWPNPDQDRYVEAFTGLAALLGEGLISAIGVSNFLPEHLDRLAAEVGVLPDVDQHELHPYLVRAAEREAHAAAGIHLQAYSPIKRAGELLAEPVVTGLAQRHDATPAQVVLAWHLAHGVGAVPKSASPTRLAENLAAVELSLGPDDVAALDGLDRGQVAQDPRTFGS